MAKFPIARVLDTDSLDARLDALEAIIRPFSQITKLRQTVTQSIPDSVNTPVLFDVEDVDELGGHSTTVNTSRFTAPRTGWYDCVGVAGFGNNATGRRAVYWLVNGVQLPGGAAVLVNAALAGASGTVLPAAPAKIFLVAGDYLELAQWQQSGAALSTVVSTANQSSMTIAWLRP